MLRPFWFPRIESTMRPSPGPPAIPKKGDAVFCDVQARQATASGTRLATRTGTMRRGLKPSASLG
jgi:hypothetical protein